MSEQLEELFSEVAGVYCDGGVIGFNRSGGSAFGGTYGYLYVNKDGEVIREHSGAVFPQEPPAFLAELGCASITLDCLTGITNNVSELVAAVLSLKHLPEGWAGTLYTDSFVTQCRLRRLKNIAGKLRDGWALEVWEDEGFKGVPLRLREWALHNVRHLGDYRVVLLDGHPTRTQLAVNKGKRGNPVSIHNVRCDALCGAISKRYKELKD